jgi:predicted TIM-barrel fold metal-dependent hydrolase
MKDDPNGNRLPIKLDATSNGEYEPIPLDPVAAYARAEAEAATAAAARKLNMGRREFLVSACGAAASLAAMNRAFAEGGRRGGSYDIPAEASFELAAAEASVGGDEFIFDVQLHHLNPQGAWRGKSFWESAHKGMPRAAGCTLDDSVECLSAQQMIQDVFLDSDTDVGVLSMVPAEPGLDPLTTEDGQATAELVAHLDGNHRLLLHAKVQPNVPGEIEGMAAIAKAYKVAAWKLYTQFGPGGGYFLDDEVGIELIEKSRTLGINNICIHKGIPLGAQGYQYATCRDVGVVAKRFPDMNFILYHSGFEPARGEREYRAEDQYGINVLIDSLKTNGIGQHKNVYAELGSTWRFCMRNPEMAAHLMGKLINAVGEDNVLWGTDSIWYGSPQDQIQAFRAFQISEEFQQKFGYPAMTDTLKRKIFGLNATVPYGLSPEQVLKHTGSDAVARARENYRNNPNPHFRTHGPQTRREFLRLLSENDGQPA